jgi:hypothetical protein
VSVTITGATAGEQLTETFKDTCGTKYVTINLVADQLGNIGIIYGENISPCIGIVWLTVSGQISGSDTAAIEITAP